MPFSKTRTTVTDKRPVKELDCTALPAPAKLRVVPADNPAPLPPASLSNPPVRIFGRPVGSVTPNWSADQFGVTLPTGLPNILTGGFDKDAGGNGAGLSAGTTRSFAGAGNAVQSNSFTGLLSVTVVRVFENGNMEIAGQKELTLNNGNEYVRVRGVVRPEDVSATNIISSNRLADAQIRYTGTGQIADSSKQGWLSELMRTVSPF